MEGLADIAVTVKAKYSILHIKSKNKSSSSQCKWQFLVC